MTENSFGLAPEHWSIIMNRLIGPLRDQGASIYVFGSRARGDYKKFSDLDILVDGDVKPSFLSSISEELEESALPIRVDIVLSRDLADAYKPNVEQDKVLVA
jgi:predicted nucleotidyltransferase